MVDKGGVRTWELAPERSWDVIKENENGELIVLETPEEQLRQKRRTHVVGGVKRGMDRHLFIIIDNSQAMDIVDMKPWDRRTATMQLCERFIKEFFDQNPISHLGIIVTANGIAVKITELSGSPERHISRLKTISESGGEPSLQNALQVALASLAFVPKYGSREIVVIMGSLTTCDPGNIHQTITELRQERVRTSVICLSAEVRLYKTLASRTKGVFSVPLSVESFRDAMLDHTPPPPTQKDVTASLLEMGFPKERRDATPALCVCHRALRYTGYQCPRCRARCCELPTTCNVCGLALLASPHLARSHHHLYPIEPFTAIEKPNDIEKVNSVQCFGCNQLAHKGDTTGTAYQCLKCQQLFCEPCDALIHDSLHVCPGCAQI